MAGAGGEWQRYLTIVWTTAMKLLLLCDCYQFTARQQNDAFYAAKSTLSTSYNQGITLSQQLISGSSCSDHFHSSKQEAGDRLTREDSMITQLQEPPAGKTLDCPALLYILRPLKDPQLQRHTHT